MPLGGGEIRKVVQQSRVPMGAHFGVAKLARLTTRDFTAQLLGHGLHAVTDAQDGDTQLEYGIRRTVR